MCGRFYLFSTGAAVADLFNLAGPVEVAPRYNIAPSQPVAVVRLGEHGRELAPVRTENVVGRSGSAAKAFVGPGASRWQTRGR
jgi:putative SOS response-associated peptidase YedK